MVKKSEHKKTVGTTKVVQTPNKKNDVSKEAAKKDRVAANMLSAKGKSKAVTEKVVKMEKEKKDKAKEMEKMKKEKKEMKKRKEKEVQDAKRKEKEAQELKKKKEKEAQEIKKKKEKETQELKKKKEKEAQELKKKMEKEAQELKKKMDKEAQELKKKMDKEAQEMKKKMEKEAREMKKKKEKEAQEMKKRKEKEALDAKKKRENEALDAKKEKGAAQTPKKRVRNRSHHKCIMSTDATLQPDAKSSKNNVGPMATPRKNAQSPSPMPNKVGEAKKAQTPAGEDNGYSRNARSRRRSKSVEPGNKFIGVRSAAGDADVKAATRRSARRKSVEPRKRRRTRSSSGEPARMDSSSADSDARSNDAVKVTRNRLGGRSAEPQKPARAERRRSQQSSTPSESIAASPPSAQSARGKKSRPSEDVRTLSADATAFSRRKAPESSRLDVGKKTSRVRSRSSKKPQSNPISRSPPSTVLALRNPKSAGKTTIILESGSIPAYVLRARAAAAQEENKGTTTSSAEPCLTLQLADVAVVAKQKLSELAKLHVMREIQTQVKARAVALARAQASDYEKARAETLLAKAKAESLARSAKAQAAEKAAKIHELHRAKAAARTEAKAKAAKAKLSQFAARPHGVYEAAAASPEEAAAMQSQQHALNPSMKPETPEKPWSRSASAYSPPPPAPARRSTNSGGTIPIASVPIPKVPIKVTPPRPSSAPPSHGALAKARAPMDKWAVSPASRNANAMAVSSTRRNANALAAQPPAAKYQRPRTWTPPPSSPSEPATSSRASAQNKHTFNHPSNAGSARERTVEVGSARERVHRFAVPHPRATHSPVQNAVPKNRMASAPVSVNARAAASARRSASVRSRSTERSDSSSDSRSKRKLMQTMSRRPQRSARSRSAPRGASASARSQAPVMPPMRTAESRKPVAPVVDRSADICVQHAYRGMVEPAKVKNVAPQPYESQEATDEEGGLFSDEEEKPFPVAYADENRSSSFVPHIPDDRMKWDEAVRTAKKELHIDGDCEVGGRSAKSKMLYFRSLELYHTL